QTYSRRLLLHNCPLSCAPDRYRLRCRHTHRPLYSFPTRLSASTPRASTPTGEEAPVNPSAGVISTSPVSGSIRQEPSPGTVSSIPSSLGSAPSGAVSGSKRSESELTSRLPVLMSMLIGVPGVVAAVLERRTGYAVLS